jgi:hypothetical protein
MRQDTASPESKKALLQAFDQVLKTQAAERDEAERAARAQRLARGRSRAVTWSAVLILLCTAAYLWVERPTWLFPAPPLPESTAIREASLRISLANAAQHIERYRQQHHRLPATLREAGTLSSGIGYEISGDGSAYQLQGMNGPVRLTLRSTDALPAFLGNSFDIITRRSR